MNGHRHSLRVVASSPEAATPSTRAAPRTDGSETERIYRDHWKPLCVRLRRVFGAGPPEPEDLAQIAFTKFMQRVDPDRIEEPGAFLFRIAVNAGRDRLRHVAVTRRLLEEQLQPLDGGEVDRITPSNVYESKERLAVTAAAIRRLPAKQREILVRSRIRGETFEQIRAATGWSKADISRSLQSAMAVLQRAMRDYDGNGVD